MNAQTNSFKYNQQRIATIKYLGELYNYRVVDSRVVFDTLWSLVTFGHRAFSPRTLIAPRADPRCHSGRTPVARRTVADRLPGRLLPRAPSLHPPGQIGRAHV